MSDCIEITYGSEDIKKYQQDILNGEYCRMFLPASFVNDKESTTAVYKLEGYTNIAYMNKMKACSALQILVDLIRSMIESERHYFAMGDYSIDWKCVYVDTENGEVRLIYKKGPGDDKASVRQEMVELLELCRAKCSKTDNGYFDKAVEIIARGHSSMGIIKHRLEELKKEAFMCEC